MLIADSQVHVQSVSCVRLALWILKIEPEPSRPQRRKPRSFLSYGECERTPILSPMDKASLQHQDDLPATLVRIRRGILHIGAQLQNIGKNAPSGSSVRNRKTSTEDPRTASSSSIDFTSMSAISARL